MLSYKAFKTLRTRAAYTKAMTKALAMALDEGFATKTVWFQEAKAK